MLTTLDLLGIVNDPQHPSHGMHLRIYVCMTQMEALSPLWKVHQQLPGTTTRCKSERVYRLRLLLHQPACLYPIQQVTDPVSMDDNDQRCVSSETHTDRINVMARASAMDAANAGGNLTKSRLSW